MASKSLPGSTVPPKPVTEIWRPELTRLPELHWPRLFFRRLARSVACLLLALLTRTTITGMDGLPRSPALIAVNHLGDADAVVLLAAFRMGPEVLAKIEMLSFPVIGKWMEWYGMIWLHRGQPDRRALRAALLAFEEGRSLVIAPEGRYSLVKGLEPGGRGTAYIAARAGVPVIPLALTGTRNADVYGNLRRFRRPRITLTVGEPVDLLPLAEDHAALQENTERIMRALARLLPPEYRGAYR
jgi:1-acyl-sn-glycerol-3-phosphate acyltransferase